MIVKTEELKRALQACAKVADVRVAKLCADNVLCLSCLADFDSDPESVEAALDILARLER